MGLTKEIGKTHKIKDVKRVQYFDSRYYKVQYEQNKKLRESFLPSVTQILNAYPKDFLARWRGDVGNERADQIVMEALKLGSFIHYGAEILAKRGAVIFNPIQNPIYTEKEINNLIKKHGRVCVCQYQAEYVQLYRIWQFFETVKPVNIETEQTVYSIKHQYAGTLDILLEIPKAGLYYIAGTNPIYLEQGFYIGDYKTGKGVGLTYKLQLAAYMEAVMEGVNSFRKTLKGGLLIHPANEKIVNGITGLKTTLIDRQEQKGLFESFLKVYDVYKIENPVPKPTDYTMPAILTITPSKKTKTVKKKR